MSAPVVLVEPGRVTTITINRPEVRNAVNGEVAERLGAALDAADRAPETAVVVVTGAGDRAFCAGADLKANASGAPPPIHPVWGFAGMTQHPISKPVIAAVNGLAFGGGAELVLAADLTVAAAHATFAFPEVRRGRIAAAGGLIRLGQCIPSRVALELLLTGREMDASEAARWGLVNRVAPAGELMAATYALAEGIAANAPLAVQATKRVVLGISGGTIPAEHAAWALNDDARVAIAATADAAEGARSFVERRPARWQAR